MEAPQRLRIVPPIVEQERVELHAPLALQLLAERRNHRQCLGLVELREVAEVVPGVVVKEWAVGMCALALHVRQEVTSKLTGARGPDDRRQLELRVRPKRQLARDRRAD